MSVATVPLTSAISTASLSAAFWRWAASQRVLPVCRPEMIMACALPGSRLAPQSREDDQPVLGEIDQGGFNGLCIGESRGGAERRGGIAKPAKEPGGELMVNGGAAGRAGEGMVKGGCLEIGGNGNAGERHAGHQQRVLDTGKRVSRLNPEGQWIVKNVPELRIIDQALWDGVKARQGEPVSQTKAKAGKELGDRRRPRYLFSGLLKCGACGGGFVKISQEHFGCATARNKGTCSNLTTIKREELEATVLNGLQHHLMDPGLCEVFAEEYTRHMNKLRSERNASLEGYRAELVKVRKDIDRVIEAIIDGVPGSQVKDKMTRLEARKQELETLLGGGGLMRSLVDRIVLTPDKLEGRTRLSVDLFGALAGILVPTVRSD